MIGRDSEVETEQIRQASDILEVVSSYVTVKRAGKDFKALCPFHNEKTPSFYVVPDKQIFKCFGCSAGGDVFKFIQLRENVGFPEAREILASRAGITLTVHGPTTSAGLNKSDLARVNNWAYRWFQKQLRGPDATFVRKYIADRGIDEESVERFALGYAPQGWDSLSNAAKAARIPAELLLAAGLTKNRSDGSSYDAFRHRLIFPIHDAMNRIIGFGGRTLGDDPAKYLNSPQSMLFDKSRCLYGLHTAKEAFASEHAAIVVEGYVDCILAQQSGFPQTVATLGTALTADHCRLLQRYVDSVILVFDSDEAGRRAADQSMGTFLAERLDVRLAHVPKGKDPAEMLVSQGAESFRGVLTSASDALEFKWNQVRRRYQDAASGPDQRRAIEEFLSLIASSAHFGKCDPIQRGLILNQVGKLLGLSSEEVNRQLRIIARRVTPAAHASSSLPEPREASKKAPDAIAMVMRELLEVLLNEPGYYDVVASVFDADLLADEELGEIARAALEMAQQDGCIRLPELISRFESADMSRRITDLQISGERLGNYEARVEGAVARLQSLKEDRRIESLKSRGGQETALKDEEISNSGNPQAYDDAEDERTWARALSDVARKTNHFAARKHRAAPGMTGAELRGSQFAG
ncbi:MAG: DNA primase [Phycisphaerales bacterium]|nr:DNA primase [Phycisphaerales bacterium]